MNEKKRRPRISQKPDEKPERRKDNVRDDKKAKKSTSDKRESKPSKPRKKESKPDELVRLNKYIANAGICSRREADKLIEAGAIRVNGEIVTRLGTKIKPTDKVQYGDQTLDSERPVYVLLNKPKGYITTTDDPHERKTVMLLVGKACKERIYPVGRLDRNTTGVLLFTNDGELAKKLIHPRHNVKKVYHVALDKNLSKRDMITVADGVELDDGKAYVDKIAWVNPDGDKSEVGLELHSGKNRIVRRIFEHLDYKVIKLDRVMFAGLTKKDLPRGKWRFLSPSEVNLLKRLS